MKHQVKLHLIRSAEYLLILFAGVLATSYTHNSIVGDLVVVALFGYCRYSDWRVQKARQKVERQAREAELQAQYVVAQRLAARIDAELTKALATDKFTILSQEQWPASKIAEWPETPQTPAPLMAWDVVVEVHDGSYEPEKLSIYLDTQFYTLPAVSPDDHLQGQHD